MRFFISNQSGFSVVQLKLLTLVLALSTILLPLSAKAVTIVVNSTNGGSGGVTCSLADAITAANTGGTSGACSAGSNGGDQIIFDGSLNNSTITLTADLPTVTNDLIVTGPSGNNQITISGDDTYSIFIVQGVRLNLLNLKLTEGYGSIIGPGSSTYGGAVAALSGALVAVDNCTLSENSAAIGGAVYAKTSSVSLTNSTVSNNNAGAVGGGIYAYYEASVSLVNSVLSDNYAGNIGGGAQVHYYSTMTVENSNVSNNSAFLHAGGIGIAQATSLEVISSIVTNNNAGIGGGGIYAHSGTTNPLTAPTVSVVDSNFSNNSVSNFPYNLGYYYGGGAIGGSMANINILSSTFSGNSSSKSGGVINVHNGSSVNLNSVFMFDNEADYYGGAIYSKDSTVNLVRSFLSDNSVGETGGAISAENGAFIAVSESTLSSNSANLRGGAVFADGSIVEFTNSTVSSNYSGVEGGAIYANNATSLELNNSTLAENIGGSVFAFNASGAVLRNTVLAGGHCDQDASSTVTLNGGVHIDDGTCGATLVGPSQLAQLDYNGADPIPTHMPIPGSPLVDHGVGGANPATDQLGNNRIVGVAIDIGAVELSDPPLFETYNLSAFLQTLTTDQSIAADLDDYITDSDSSRLKVTAKHLPHGLTRDSSSGTPRDVGVFITEYTVEDDNLPHGLTRDSSSGTPRDVEVFITEYTVEDDTENQVKAFIDTIVLKGGEITRRFR